MNNEQFRKLLLANSAKQTGTNGASQEAKSTTPSSLGARQRQSIPMTPRSIGLKNNNSDFARQVAERNRAANPQKKHRTSAPKGVKLGSGYVDRAKARQEEEEDEKTARIEALEELLKKGEVDQATFEKLRDEIAGGDLSTTHMVKGLDFKLLERIKRGEDVYGKSEAAPEKDREANAEDPDDELDKVLGQEVVTIEKEKREKKGQLSTVALAPGKKRTRDQILAELKAVRAAAQEKKKDDLGGRFKRIGVKQAPGSRIERDSKGREVLIIVDEDGHEKRKIRKIQPGASDGTSAREELPMPDKNAAPLGMEVPEIYRKKEEEPEDDGDVDIFDGVGDDYDPLAGLGSDSDEDSDAEEDAPAKGKTARQREPTETPAKAQGPRNYFGDSKADASLEEIKPPSLADPTIMAALKKAATLNPIGSRGSDDSDDEDGEGRARRERMKKLLESADRDAEDMDMGFGTSRFEDEDDFDDSKIKLSKWQGEEDDGDNRGRGSGGRSTRKRGPKKRKGDGNNAADVMRVLEQRKAREK